MKYLIIKPKSAVKPNNFENLIKDQKFKIEKPDKTFMDYLEDCGYLIGVKYDY